MGTGSEVDLMAELLEMLRRNLGDCDTSIDSEINEDSDSDSAVFSDDADISEENQSMEGESEEDNGGDLLDDLLEILRREFGDLEISVDSEPELEELSDSVISVLLTYDDDSPEEDQLVATVVDREVEEADDGDLLDDLLEILRRDLGDCATSIDSKSDEDSDFSDEDQSMEGEFEEANGMDQWTNFVFYDGSYDEPSHTCLATIHMINEILGRNNSSGLQL